ncbi:MAG: Holliday junction resolvase RuvX [Verrucomicrobia bacterium]|nr:Holliday junction resolvase RuvX [Verrucomicrobiota bacterium]
MMRWLGIDYGDSRIGLAISDELALFAHPMRTLKHGQTALKEIRFICESQPMSGVVIGLPKNMNGTLGSSSMKVKKFGRDLAAEIPAVKIIYWDERLTTVQAQRVLHSTGKNARQSKAIIDQVAAQILLQSYLDSLQWSNETAVPS